MRKIKYLAAIIFSFFIFSRFCFAFDDVSYDIKASFYPEEKKIEASETLKFKNTSGQDISEIYLRVYPNHKYSKKEKINLYKYATYFRIDPYPKGFDAGKFSIGSIASGGKELKFSFEGEDQTILKVKLAEPLKNNETFELSIDFSVTIPHHIGRFGWHEGTF
ncbi:MAG TPA: hypothetical protein PLU24_03390, partial [Candidatus Omnitrophota bacterium]|nr:hypothetical protein [Candidatus Omnitrophota bacterium]